MNITSATVFRLTVLAAALSSSNCLSAEELWFPPELVSENGNTADLSRFTQGGQLPGTYTVAVYLNGEQRDMLNIRFVSVETDAQRAAVTDSTGLTACLTRQELITAGVRPEAFGDMPETDDNVSAISFIPQATTHFNFQTMRLDISIPQRWMQRQLTDWVPPERWDDGITAGLLNYTYSSIHYQGRSNSSSDYLRLNSGFNTGPWRLRDERTMTEYRSTAYHQREWRHGQTWLERSVRALRSRLVIGDTTTEGELFNSVALRGVRLMTDENMYPHQERGYAPVIRGTALGNARVSISQNGYVVYETNVAPGEFAIDDINPMYSSGDLDVMVTEADGGVRRFTVPYATVPGLMREERMKYAFSAGSLQSRGQGHAERTGVVQATLSRGMSAGVTTYGGMQYARQYQAAAFGSGINMGSWGAFSADLTHANSTLADHSHHAGQSLRFLYSRGFDVTGTTFQLAGYRYSTRGFFTLEDSQRPVMQGWQGELQHDVTGRALPRPVSEWFDLSNHRRERMDINVSQRLGDNSSLYLTGSRQTYWHGQGTSTSLQAMYGSTLGAVSYHLGYNENHSPSLGRTDRSMNMSLSVPLEKLFGEHTPSLYASFSTGQDSHGGISQQSGLSGHALEMNNLNWNVSQGYSRQNGNNGSVHLGYQGAYGNLSAGYSQGQHYHQTSYDMTGSVILHSDGITAGPQLGDTSVLVAVPGAPGIPLAGGNGVRTDWQGYAVQPWVSEYQDNRVALDVAHLDARTEISEPVSHITPTRGAIVRAEFAARTGLRGLMTLMKDGAPLPFGTTVSTGDSSGIVGDEGQVFLTGLSRHGTLNAKWGNNANQACKATWNISAADTNSPLVRATVVCQ